MKKYFILCLTLLCFTFCRVGVLAQTAQIDSLEGLLRQKELPDSAKAEFMCDLAFALRNRDIEKAVMYAKRAEKLAAQIGYARGIARAKGYQGMMDYRRGRYDFAIDQHLASLRIAVQIRDSMLIGYRLNDLSNIYIDINELEKGTEYTLKSLAIKQKIGDKEGMATCYRNLGMVYLKKEGYDSSLYFFNKAQALAEETGDRRVQAYICIYLGQWHTLKGEHDQAHHFLSKAVQIHQEIGNDYGLAEALNSFGNAMRLTYRFEEAANYYRQALSLAEKVGIKLEISRAFEGLSLTYEAVGNAKKALEYYRKYTQTKDIIFTDRNRERILYLETQFESEMNRARINLLTKEKILKQQEVDNSRLTSRIFVGIIFFGVLSFGGVVFVLRQKLKINRLLSDQKENLLKQNEEINHQKEALYTQSEALQRINLIKDKLFSVIAHDLRSPMATLRSLIDILDLDILNSEELKQIKIHLSSRFSITDKLLQNLLIWVKSQMQGENTLPVFVDFFELTESKKVLFAQMAEHKKIAIQSNVQPGTLIWADENHLKTIVRNLIAKALKFSREGSQITINALQTQEKYIEISVQDEGVGMSETQLKQLFTEQHSGNKGTDGEPGSGLGLRLVKDLSEQNGGHLRIESCENQGSTFYVRLPSVGE